MKSGCSDHPFRALGKDWHFTGVPPAIDMTDLL